MPYHDNGSLVGRLKRSGPMRWPDVADIGVRLAGALQTAHDAGILHRDLKPANILLDDYDGPRLADFGQARLGDADLTRTGEAAVRPGFAAPEVCSTAIGRPPSPTSTPSAPPWWPCSSGVRRSRPAVTWSRCSTGSSTNRRRTSGRSACRIGWPPR